MCTVALATEKAENLVMQAGNEYCFSALNLANAEFHSTMRKFEGRRKIAIEKIERKDYREITFAKRRYGLFKKASELSTLCGAETALVVFSPSNKAFSYGDPSVNFVIEKLLAPKTPNEVGESSTAEPPVDHQHTAYLKELNRQVTEIESQLEAEKKRGKMLKQMEKSGKDQLRLWNSPIEDLELHELEQLRASLEDLSMKVLIRSDELLTGTSPVSSLMAANPVGMVDPEVPERTQ